MPRRTVDHWEDESSSGEVNQNSCCESDDQYESRGRRKLKTPTKQSPKINETPGSSSSRRSRRKQRAMDDDLLGREERPSASSPITPMSSYAEERMRRRLKFFFMNPIEKWHAKRRFPYKFFIQIVKIVLVTMQLCLFAHSRYTHVNYTWDNRVSFSHLFLDGWDASREVTSYPPGAGPLAIYAQEDFYKTIDYAVTGYGNISDAIGPYSYPNEDNSIAPIKLCLYQYRKGTIFGFNESYIFDSNVEVNCLLLDGNASEVGSEQFLADQSVPLSFSALVRATLEMSLKTVNFKAAGPLAAPDCYQFDITILMDNQDHDGQMQLSLDAEAVRLHCKGNMEYRSGSQIEALLRTCLNVLVIIVCAVSFALCTRALYRAQLLRQVTVKFFWQSYQRPLSCDGQMEFLNIWYIMIICNDVLLVMGSGLKQQIQANNFTANEWNACALFLGIGNLLVWFGLLRYLGFFKTYNVVILTLKRAAPKMSRFLICALIIYAGFMFSGWLILGPYHIKFRSLATTSECLYSLINGDDMFATFSIMSSKSPLIWWFSRIYLYSFISLYIYVVLSLFISVIMDAYDTIKEYYRHGFPLNDLRQFVGPIDPADYQGGAFRANEQEDEQWLVDDASTDVVGRWWSAIKRGLTGWEDPRGNGGGAGAGGTRVADNGPTGYTTLVPGT